LLTPETVGHGVPESPISRLATSIFAYVAFSKSLRDPQL
jgi:hypothetical protein